MGKSVKKVSIVKKKTDNRLMVLYAVVSVRKG